MIIPKMAGVFQLSGLLIILFILVIILFLINEKQKRKKLNSKFQDFNSKVNTARKDLRTVPRIAIPEALEILLQFNTPTLEGAEARVINMSLSGFAVKPLFSLKKIPLDQPLQHIILITPVNNILIKQMRPVRMEDQLEKKLIAMQIDEIEENYFSELKKFMLNLNEFIAHGEQ